MLKALYLIRVECKSLKDGKTFKDWLNFIFNQSGM